MNCEVWITKRDEWFVTSFFAMAFHLDEPCGPADARLGDDEGCKGKTAFHVSGDTFCIGHVAQIDDEIFHVRQRASPIAHQHVDVGEQAVGLSRHVAKVNAMALLVDARRAGDDEALAVEAGAAFESHAVLVGGIEVFGGLEIAHLLRDDVLGGIEVHRHQGGGHGSGAAYARGGDEMGVEGEALPGEDIVAGTHHGGVVDIDVAHIKPRADAMVLEGEAERLEQIGMPFEGHYRLTISIGAGAFVGSETHRLENMTCHMAVLTVGHRGVVVLPVYDLQATLRVTDEKIHVMAVERRLFNVGEHTAFQSVADGMVEQQGPLVGGIREEELGQKDASRHVQTHDLNVEIVYFTKDGPCTVRLQDDVLIAHIFIGYSDLCANVILFFHTAKKMASDLKVNGYPRGLH
jgi:hypothetical protein